MEKTWKNVFFGGGTDMAVFCPNKRQDGMDIACRPVFCQPLHGQMKASSDLSDRRMKGYKRS
jgi:hypothetical protein